MSNRKVPPIPGPAQQPLQDALDTGLGNLTLRELLETLLAAAARALRSSLPPSRPPEANNKRKLWACGRQRKPREASVRKCKFSGFFGPVTLQIRLLARESLRQGPHDAGDLHW